MMALLLVTTYLHLFTTNIAAVTEYCSGEYIGVRYCAYYKGDASSKIIINSPHGGFLKPISISNREDGCFINGACVWTHGCGVTDSANCSALTSSDDNTLDIAFLLQQRLYTLTGSNPHLIVSYLHRSKLDPNREINEATLGVSEAVTAYNELQSFLQTARNNITGNGLFLDIHGHTHSTNLTELGYLVTKTRLNTNTVDPNLSSLKSLNNRLQPSVSFEDVLRGSKSIGKYLQNQGFQAVPSPNNPSPGTASYFSGDYNVKTYGSKNGGTVDGVQIEIHESQRSEVNLVNYVNALASSVLSFMTENSYLS